MQSDMRSKPDEHLHACLTWNKLTVRYVSPKSNAGFTMNGGRKHGKVQKTWQNICTEKSIT